MTPENLEILVLVVILVFEPGLKVERV